MTRIVDLSCDYGGRYAARLLADQGHEVIGVRLPDTSVAWPEVKAAGLASADLDEMSGHLERNKLLLTVDYDTPRGREELAAVIADADFLIHTFNPQLAERFGLDAKSLQAAQPDLVVLSITPYGHEGVEQGRLATEKTLYADSGGVLIAGAAETRHPLCPNIPILSTMGGIYGAICTLAVGMGRRRETGLGFRHVDIALRDLLPASLERLLPFYTYMKIIPYRGARRERIDVTAAMGEFAAKDGAFHVFAIHDPYAKIAELIGRPDLAQDEKWLYPHLHKVTPEETTQIVAEAVAKLTVAELEQRGRKLRLPAGPVVEIPQLETLPQLQHRKALNRTPEGLEIEEPYRFASGDRRREPTRPLKAAANLPQKTAESAKPCSAIAPNGDGPLSGIRVLDLTHAYAGPSCTRILSDLGAEVLKVESVTRLDAYPRGLLPFDNDPTDVWWERSGYFAERNIGKKGLTLDMSTPKGREIFVSLLEHVDVVATNFTPRVMPSWGLGPDELLKMKPDLVVLSMSGFGGTGPDSEKPALAGLIEASSGFTSMIRYADGEAPTDVGFSFGDMVSGLYAALSTLFALDRRDRTGAGDIIDLSCSEAPLPFLAVQLQEWARTGQKPSAAKEIVPGGRHVLIRAEGDDTPERWVLVFVRQDQETQFAQLIGVGSGPLTSSLEQEELVTNLRSGGFAAAALTNAEELLFNTELRARQIYQVVNRASVGPLPHARVVPVLCNGVPLGRRELGPAPRLGQHSREIFAELLGMSEEQYSALEQEQVTGDQPAGNLPSILSRPVRLGELIRRGRARPVEDAADRLAREFGYAPPAATQQKKKEKTL